MTLFIPFLFCKFSYESSQERLINTHLDVFLLKGEAECHSGKCHSTECCGVDKNGSRGPHSPESHGQNDTTFNIVPLSIVS